MKTQRKQFVMMSILAVLLAAVLAMLNGCKKSEPQTMAGHEEHQHAMPMAEPAKAVEAAKTAIAEAIVQKKCPIMGGPIDKTVFTEYRGKKVYFCCPDCKPKFEANPEQYIAKLPQFKQ